MHVRPPRDRMLVLRLVAVSLLLATEARVSQAADEQKAPTASWAAGFCAEKG